MKIKTLALVSGILVLLAVAALAVNRWMDDAGSKGRIGQPLMAGVEPSNVARIEVVTAEHTVNLNTKDGVVWTVAEQQDFPVDTKKIKNLFVKLTSVKLAHEVTRNADKLADLGLLTEEENDGKQEQDKTGKRVSVYGKDGKPLFRLLIGKDRRGQGGMSFGGVYVRHPEQSTAYLISDALLTEQRPQDWIDTVVLDVEADKTLQAVRVRRAGQRPVELSHEQEGAPWAVAGMPPAQVDQDAVKRVINQLGGLDVFKVAAGDADPKELGRAKVGQVEFTFFDKRRFTMEVGEAKAPDDFRYLSIRAHLDPAVDDAKLKDWVRSFNERFAGRLLGVYDWDGSRMLQGFEEYRKKEDGKQP
jgi:hypothetical protein